MAEVRRELRAFEFRNWFKPVAPVAWHNGTVTLQVRDSDFQKWFVERYEPVLLRALELTFDKPMTVEYNVLDRDLFEPASAPLQEAEQPIVQPLIEGYNFQRFIVGPSNHMAYAAGKAVSEKPGRAYNPLFIYGGTGLGKTHMLHAIGHATRHQDPRVRVQYITAENYFHDMTAAIRSKSMEHFRVKYRDACDMLLVDDVQFMAGKPRTQEEFFHTFNSLHAVGKQIVFTSDRFPQDLPEIEDRLCSRFEWGLITELGQPTLSTRISILMAKASEMDINLDEKTARTIAKRVRDNIRELESCLHTLHLISHTTGQPITPELAEDKLKAYFNSRIKRVRVEQIQQAVAKNYGLTEAELKSRSRKRTIATPRHIAMYLSRKLTIHSFPELGEKFGGRDHSSVIAGTRKIERQRKVDSDLQQQLQTLEQQLRR